MPEESAFRNGTYQGYRVSLRLVREGEDLYRPCRIDGPEDVYRFFEELRELDREVFYSLHLDGKHHVVGCEEVSKGSAMSTLVHPREIYKAAFLNNAAAIIVAHNHPSGDVRPSREDQAVTTRLYKAGQLLGVPVLDHVIIGRETYYSMNEHRTDLPALEDMAEQGELF